MPFVGHLVYQLVNSDGSGNDATYTYSYEGGDYYYNNNLDRKFAGFNKVTKTDAAGNKTVTYFHQGNTTDTSNGEYSDAVAKIGKIYRVENQDSSGNAYTKLVNKWDLYNLGGDRNFVKKVRATELTYDGDSDHKDKAEEYTYDNTYGNLTEKVEYGEVTGSNDGTFTDTGNDKYTTTVSYAANTTPYIVGLPSQITKVDQSANKVKEDKYYYDSQALGSVTDGNMTKQEMWKSGSSYIDIEKTYNTTYGIVTQEKDGRDKITSYSYDTHNIYPTTITDPLSQTTQYVYDYSLGKPKQATDQNGFVYKTTYDGLDRVLAQKIPDFTTPYGAVTKTAYAYTDTSSAVKIQKTDYLDGSITADTYQYFDSLGRLIQERKEAETAGSFNVKDTVYNNVGLIQKQSLPYTSSGSSKTSATSTTALYVTNTYDPLQRPSTVVDATGTTSYAYDDWKTTVTDKNSKVKKYHKDAYNNLVKVDEINGASTYTTNYEWNGNNKLTKITDALSNIRNFTYDGLGRRLTAEDLHASADGAYGTWTYTYDDAGNLTQTVSPRSLTTNYTYNDINQQLTEDYTGAGGTEITYTYGGCTNGVEKLCSVTMTSGANTAYTYHSNGNVASEAKTINSTAYTTSYTYDRQGNKLIITYPDSAEARYTFNTAGLLEKIERKESGGSFTDVISDFDYSPIDQVTIQTYPNTVTTTNTYDATKMYRLTRKLTQNTVPLKLQDINYTYDSMGNITGINEQSDTDAAREVNYTYDDLYRLTQYSRAVVGDPSGNWFNNSWNYRIKVTIPSGKVSSDLTNFPVYVNLANLPSGFHTNVKSDGGDIRVTKSDGTTELPREVTNYNSSTDTGELHVLYNGTLQSGQNNEFYIYYGNSSASDYASTDTYGSRAVWANYNFVSHEGAISDATGNHSPTNNGTTQSSDTKLGPASRDYESSSSQYISVSDSSLLDLAGNFSLEGWFKFESLTSGGYFIWSHYDAPNSFTDIYYNADNDRIFLSSINAGSWSLSAYITYTFIPGQWYHLAVQGPALGGGSQSDWKVFVNGIALGALNMDVGSWSNAWGSKSATINIGRQGNASNYLDGLMDEFRLKSELLSAGWIGAEYSNQGDPSNFYSIGSQESREGGGGSFETQNFTYDAIGNISSGPIGSYTYSGTNYANPHAATSINGVTYTYDNDGNLTGNGTLSNTWNYKNQLTQSVIGGTTNTYTYDHAGERASTSDGTTTTVYPNDAYNYRRDVFTEETTQTLKNICLDLALRYEIHFLEIGTDEDHVHFLIQSVPTFSSQRIVQTVKSITGRRMFKTHPDIREKLWGGEFWTKGYYVNTVGQYGNEVTTPNYVKNQGRHYQQIHHDTPTLFEGVV